MLRKMRGKIGAARRIKWRGEKKIPQEELEKIIKKVLKENPKVLADYKRGKEEAINVLIGKVMRETKGKAQARKIREMIKKNL